MKLRGQFTIMIGIPIIGMAIVCVLGLLSFRNLSSQITDLNGLHSEYETMIHGDRDGYQALVATQDAANSLDLEELNAVDESVIENTQQTWDRTLGSSENFSDEMQPLANVFKEYFELWKMNSREVIDTAVDTAGDNQTKLASVGRAVTAFNAMRDYIDTLGVLIEDQLAEQIDEGRRMELESALSLCLNADRDAYQAYVFLLLALNAASSEELDSFNADNLENIEQTGERVTAAAEIAGVVAQPILIGFNEYYPVWKSESRNVLELALTTFEENSYIHEQLELSNVNFSTMRDAIDQLGAMQEARAVERTLQMEGEISKTIITYIIVVAASLLISIAVTIILVVSMLRAIKKSVSVAQSVSMGNLDTAIDIQRKDEIGNLSEELQNMTNALKYKAEIIRKIADKDFSVQIEKASDEDGLGESLQTMKKSLNDVLWLVDEAVEQVESGAGQVAQASQTLSQGSTEQASSLEEISSSINQINGQSKQNAQNASEANSLAQEASHNAMAGNEQMIKLKEAMGNISISSNEIKKVVKVIDDIAFQINLLALNANVEAARAGKYGKGFAVVADEVRNLAVRSAEAVKETTSMVEESVRNIELGNEVSDLTANQLKEIVEMSTKVADFLSEIAAASNEQAQAIEQITDGLDQIDQVTQSNTASAEESASASEELAAQSQQLQGIIDQFVLEKKISIPAPDSLDKSVQPALLDNSGNGGGFDPSKVIALDDSDYGRF
jgi:methyl-accepting chemotaxis protein